LVSEANHYTTFLAFARQYGADTEDVNARWQQWLEYEAGVVKQYGKSESIHG
jgi:tRNA-(ms[2]io[6]A)-hydroxylase